MDKKTLVVFILGAFFFIPFVPAYAVTATADQLILDHKNRTTTWLGNVTITTDTATLNGDSVVINHHSRGDTVIRVRACNSVQFETKNYRGSGDRIYYNVQNDTGILAGNAVLHNKNKKQTIKGDTIIIDRETRSTRVLGRAHGILQ